ncbi:hypothetical protein FIA58_009480 [Flavobacterium jejuense]|uniref:Class IIb bacteriocin, lactobin A/cerein 7B family n=1 Tax=Flavobacterium jejuense TaxID=1544455 RepID=A0ABX0IPZ4_9FLAO|nr:hypothetical protein [Flavobacterium jejuense]NHN25904.1 hypothetical protein [Flavobacterium jejuense]
MGKTKRLSINELKEKWSDVEITQSLGLIVGGIVAATECHVTSNSNGSYTDDCTGNTFWPW